MVKPCRNQNSGDQGAGSIHPISSSPSADLLPHGQLLADGFRPAFDSVVERTLRAPVEGWFDQELARHECGGLLSSGVALELDAHHLALGRWTATSGWLRACPCGKQVRSARSELFGCGRIEFISSYLPS